MNYCATKYSQRLITETKNVWQSDALRTLTDQEAIEIIENTIALFDLLVELEEKYGQA